MATHKTKRYPITVRDNSEVCTVLADCWDVLRDMQEKLAEVHAQALRFQYPTDTSQVLAFTRALVELDHSVITLGALRQELGSAHWFFIGSRIEDGQKND